MELFDGIAGSYIIFGDLVSIFAFGCAVLMAAKALFNLGYYKDVNVRWQTYLAFFMSLGFWVAGQLAFFISGKVPIVMGVLGQPPIFTNMTFGFALALFVISVFLRKRKYASVDYYD